MLTISVIPVAIYHCHHHHHHNHLHLHLHLHLHHNRCQMVSFLPLFPADSVLDELSIAPLLMLMYFYGSILYTASCRISDGSEMLLLLYGPGVVGGLISTYCRRHRHHHHRHHRHHTITMTSSPSPQFPFSGRFLMEPSFSSPVWEAALRKRSRRS